MKPKIQIRKTKKEILDAYKYRYRDNKVTLRLTTYHKKKLDAYREKYNMTASQVIEQILDLMPNPRVDYINDDKIRIKTGRDV